MQNDSQRGKMAQIKWIKVHKSQYLNIFPTIRHCKHRQRGGSTERSYE